MGTAREKVVQKLLSRVLPSIYEVGSGQLVDAEGRYSKQMDVVIARRDFPIFCGPGESKTYPIESVLATIEVKTHLDGERLWEAMENIASISNLGISIVAGTRARLAGQMGLRSAGENVFLHDNPIETARFDSLFWPPSYVIGLGGFADLEKFGASVDSWSIDYVGRRPGLLGMQRIPAVIAAGSCFGWRNTAPWAAPEGAMLLMGRDECPLRLVILHLLYTLARKIPVIPDSFGIVPNLDTYLAKCRKPEFAFGIIPVGHRDPASSVL